MSNRTRGLVLGVTLAAMNLAGLTTVAQAQTNDEPVPRPPTERQVGESWRKRPVPSQEQAAADTAQRRQTAQEQTYKPTTTPAQVPAPTRADEPSGQPAVPCQPIRPANETSGDTTNEAGARLRGLTTVTVTPLDGAAAPTRQPHHLAGDGLVL